MISFRTAFRLLVAVVLLPVLAACTATAPTATSGGDAGAGSAAELRRQEGSLVFENVPEIPPALVERLRQYQEVRSASLSGWLPSGEMLISTRFGETSQIHRVAMPGGARQQLTFFSEPVGGALPSPDPDRPGFLYLRDAGGSEFFQVYFFELATGRSLLLTDGVSRNSGAILSDDGARIAYASTRRNGRDTDVWLGDLDPDGVSDDVTGRGAERHRPLTSEAGSWFPVEFSPDGTRLIVYRYVSRSEAHPWIVDLESGAMTAILDPDRAVRVDQVAFGPEGRSIYLTSDFGGEFVRLWRLAGPGATPVAVTGDIDHDVESFQLSPDGRHLAWSINEETESRLYVRNLDRGSFVALPQLPEGVIYGLRFTPDGNRLGFTVNGSRSPGDIYSIDLGGRTLTRWTESEVGGLDPAGFVEPGHFRYATFDTPVGVRAGPNDQPRTIPAFIYRPVATDRGNTAPLPVVISIHGGPESQARPYFNVRAQFWANELGAAVIYPNVRGSTGYGRSFHQLDNGYGREDSVQDIGALLDWIATQPDLDAERVIVSGGSYGGYMVLAAMTLFPDRIAAGVESVGISNFVTFLENTQDYRRDLRRAEYGDERDPQMRAFLESISPLNRIERIRAPLLVMQGANDPRVPASESEQIVAGLRARGEEVWYLLALDEGHGFRKRGNRDVAAAVTALFLERQLGLGADQPD